jgi:hypothetical protein
MIATLSSCSLVFQWFIVVTSCGCMQVESLLYDYTNSMATTNLSLHICCTRVKQTLCHFLLVSLGIPVVAKIYWTPLVTIQGNGQWGNGQSTIEKTRRLYIYIECLFTSIQGALNWCERCIRRECRGIHCHES